MEFVMSTCYIHIANTMDTTVVLIPRVSNTRTYGQKFAIYQIYPKIHILKISFLTKFTFFKCDFSQKSHFQSVIFYKIHIFKVQNSTKFTIFKRQSLGNFWIKS